MNPGQLKGCTVGNTAWALLPCIANSYCGVWTCYGKTSQVFSLQYLAHGAFWKTFSSHSESCFDNRFKVDQSMKAQ